MPLPLAVFLLSLGLAGPLTAADGAADALLSNSAPIPKVQPLVINDPVPVPETLGASMAAGVGFLLMFRRRRLSR